MKRSSKRSFRIALTPFGAGLLGVAGGAVSVMSVAVLAWGWSTGRLSLSAVGASEAQLMAVERSAADDASTAAAEAAERELVFLPEPAGWREGETTPADARSFGGVGSASEQVEPEAEPEREARPEPAVSKPSGPTFDGRPLKVARTMTMKVTAYSPDEQSCGIWADGKTASGYSVWTNGMKLVAADTRLLPFGTVISVPGYNGGKPVQVLDRGGAIKGRRLDVLYPTHEVALKWGVQDLMVTVYEYADE